jgi:hypothetical protein
MEIGFAISNFKSDIRLGPRLEGGTTPSLSSPKFPRTAPGWLETCRFGTRLLSRTSIMSAHQKNNRNRDETGDRQKIERV